MEKIFIYLSEREFTYMRRGDNFSGTITPIPENFIPVLLDVDRLKQVPLTPTQQISVYGRNHY